MSASDRSLPPLSSQARSPAATPTELRPRGSKKRPLWADVVLEHPFFQANPAADAARLLEITAAPDSV